MPPKKTSRSKITRPETSIVAGATPILGEAGVGIDEVVPTEVGTGEVCPTGEEDNYRWRPYMTFGSSGGGDLGESSHGGDGEVTDDQSEDEDEEEGNDTSAVVWLMSQLVKEQKKERKAMERQLEAMERGKSGSHSYYVTKLILVLQWRVIALPAV